MRVIEQEMVNAIKSGNNWAKGNTSFIVSASHPASSFTAEVFLHGNRIAWVSGAERYITTDIETLREYPTVTTKSRLRALGVNVCTKQGITYLNDERI